MPNQNELETKIQELEAKLQAKEEEIRKFWEDKEKITWTEEEIKEERARLWNFEKWKKYTTKEIWNILVKRYQKEYPEEMKIIDISDLTDLALQVNDKNIHDYEFLKQFCPEEPRLFFALCKGLKYWVLDQLANRILARCLFEKYEIEPTQRENVNYFAKKSLSCEIIKKIVNIKESKNYKDKEVKNRKKLNELETARKQKEQELTNKIAELEQAKTQIKNQLTAEKNAAIQNLTAKTKKEIEELNKSKTEAIQNLEAEKNKKIGELEQAKEQIKNQVLKEKELENKKFCDKVNKKLEKGGFFTPNEQGQNLEEATDNLLEKQQKLENQIYNLEKDIRQISQQLKEEKEKYANEKLQLKARIDKVLGDKNLFFGKNSNNLEQAIDEIFGKHHKHIRSNGEKCLSVVTAPFRWTADKIGTGFALFGFMTVAPTIMVGLGWALKAFLAVKTGGVGGAVMVANGMINHQQNNQGGNLPPNYQPLPQGNNNVNNQLLPAGENSQDKAITVHNHYHNSAEEKKENNWKRRKKKNKG